MAYSRVVRASLRCVEVGQEWRVLHKLCAYHADLAGTHDIYPSNCQASVVPLIHVLQESNKFYISRFKIYLMLIIALIS